MDEDANEVAWDADEAEYPDDLYDDQEDDEGPINMVSAV